jgi:hypothetical protein
MKQTILLESFLPFLSESMSGSSMLKSELLAAIQREIGHGTDLVEVFAPDA